MSFQNATSWGRDNESQDIFANNGEKGRHESENIRLFISLKRDNEQNGENKKFTVMAPVHLKISMLKRHIEREFSDLFPHESTFICAKLEDEFGYSLSNTSQVRELLKNSDRLTAIPELFAQYLSKIIAIIKKGGKLAMDQGLQPNDARNYQQKPLQSLNSHDLHELTFMLKSIQQTVIAKFAEAELGSPEVQLDILQLIVPIGFSLQQKAINHNTALTVKRIVENERLDFMQDQQYALIFNLLVKMLSFWVNDLIFQDSFLLNIAVDILETLVKSAKFASSFKNAQTINSLMSVSKLDFVSAQTRSRIIKLISFLSKPSFTNSYEPRPYDGPLEISGSREGRRQNRITNNRNNNDSNNMLNNNNNIKYNNNTNIKQYEDEINSYQPSLMDRDQQLPRRPNSIRGRNNQNQDQPQSLQSGQKFGPSNPNNQQKNDQRSHKIQNNIPGNYYNEQPLLNNSDLNNNHGNLNQKLNQDQHKTLANKPNNSFKPDKSFNRGDNNNDPLNQVFESLVQDYLNLLSSESSEDMLIFAVQNLSDGIEQSIHSIMDSSQAYQQCINLLEITMPSNYQHLQIKILENIASNMNESRAKDGMKLKVVQRIMKTFTYQSKDFHGVLFELLSAHLQQSDFQVDVSTVISLVESPYLRISHLGIKILSLISDSNRLSSSNLAAQFENYVSQIMEWALNGSKGDEFQYNALITLSNLALNDIVRPQILYLKGIEFFLKVLRESHRVDAQRAAAKALLNLSIKSSILKCYNIEGDTKLAIVSELEDEIRMMQRGECDAVVQGYLQTLITTRDKRQMM